MKRFPEIANAVNIPRPSVILIIGICLLGTFHSSKSYAGGTDTIKPVLTIISPNPENIEVYTPFVDPGVQMYSPYFTTAQLSGRLRRSSNVDDSLLGRYTVTYTLTDSFGNTAVPVTLIVNVVDQIPPVIKLKGTQYDSVLVLNTYHDPGFTVSDNYTDSSKIKIAKSGTFVQSFKNGFAAALGGGRDSVIPAWSGAAALGIDYRITYIATDESGNSSSVTRFIEVYDNIPPVVTLTGSHCVQVCLNYPYVDLGLLASDNLNSSAQLKISDYGTFLAHGTDTSGMFTLTYFAIDQSGNASIPITRYIEVLPANDSGCQSGNASNNIIDTTVCKGSCPVFNAPVSGSAYLWSTGANSKTAQLCINNDTAISVSITNGSFSTSYMYNISVTKTSCVWPGDANGDGIADNNDVLEIGVAYSDTGAKRPNASLNWTGQPCNDWATSFKSGTNYKNADCNGDGVVDSTDMAAIYANYGYVHNKTNGGTGNPSDPDLSITFTQDSSKAGDTVSATIALGSSSKPVTNAYGLAFSIPYNFFYVHPGKATINLSNCWLGTLGKDLIYFMHDDSANSTIDFAVTRTDHKNVSGYGEIGTVSVVMQDDLGGKTYVNRKVVITPTNITLISADETPIPLYAVSDSMIVTGPSAGISNKVSNALKDIKLYPNPASDNINIDPGNQTITDIRMVNEIGMVVFEQPAPARGLIQVPVSTLNSGIYTVIISSKNGTVVRQLLKN